MKKSLCLLFAAACIISCFSGCNGVVGEVADSVLTAAKNELVTQVQEKVEQYKVTVKETKAAVGTLNDEGGKYQFYCAILIQTNEESSAADCANAIGVLFGNSGYVAQSGSMVETDKLVHKTITYDTTDFSEGNFYTVYVYIADITKIVNLKALQTAISDALGKEST